jgi:dienelactone hydrolase
MKKRMSLLVVLVLCLLPLSAQAQNVEAPLFAHSSRIYILYPMPDVAYFYDEHGNSVIMYRQWSGLAWYSARDSSGRIVQEGYKVAPPLALDRRGMPSVN